jgi:SAM-dependent methyltransferase
MNDIPADLAGRFDACWSTCSLEHLGSLQHGLDFIENSLSVLRPGGIAVHTTEFNLVSNNKTLDAPGLCVYRRRDMEALAARLIAQGHQVLPLNFHPGEEELDEVIDVPPYALPHLKLELQDMTCTSIGFAVRRAG